MSRYRLLSVILLVLPGIVLAQTAAPAAAEEESPWSGNASLGFLSTSGNTSTTNYNSAFGVAYTKNKWTHAFDAQANGADESETTTAEAYQAGWKSTYDFSEHNYVFGQVNWRKDRFSGVREQTSPAVGYGRRILDNGTHLLNAEIGAGYRDAELSDGTDETGGILTLGANYQWTWTETSHFSQDLVVESGDKNTFIESVSAVRARLLGDFAMVLSYTVRHNTEVPVGSVNTDKLTAISLEYAF